MICHIPDADIALNKADILVNTVNTVGVMGKGVALSVKRAFPEIMAGYQAACASGRLRPGGLQILPTRDGRRVVNLATKKDWRDASRPEWVGYGLFALNAWLMGLDEKPAAIALPLPGAGNGGISPALSQDMIRMYLQDASAAGIEIRVLAQELEARDLPVFYAGVGARKTPQDVLDVMSGIATLASEKSWILRSGGAIGADRAFETGSDPASSEIYLHRADPAKPEGILGHKDVHMRLVDRFHPKPSALGPVARQLMARNGCQVFGADFTRPISVLCCWTPGGKAGGGTGQAIRYAHAAGIPVIDLGKPELAGASPAEIFNLMQVAADEYRMARGLGPSIAMSGGDIGHDDP